MSLRIWFHGTNKKNANAIIKTGYFKAGTYYAKHLEDAIGYGGLHIFEVAIDFDKTPLEWQAIASNKISIKRITKYRVFKRPKTIIYNGKLIDEVSKNSD